ncbi:flagellar motor switch protein FliN [Candidatus Liberibacter africanus]|uniref:Flagellar motor switch protein FliN n=1 Tax=Candidatus Liberibacter africanus PTSAPSY TaxID=1277257 RepID=A0A0G3I6A6_LIBAF|nr:flagellar motor switch protein FliN [Candidatus Liberibacter africanus]AKK19988.1 putative flagellar motor switch protein [Candidatus Liberibacter africanus PTSAPSY]QTP63820.1 flagellar motor switch protein FliN [Candidatus Liberibacter africanus]
MDIDNHLPDTNNSSSDDNSEKLIQEDDFDNISEQISLDSNNILEKSTNNLDMILNIPVNIQIILGSCDMQISNLINLSKGDVITLDKRVGEPIDITVNNQRIAKGEITIMEEDDMHFGVRILEITNYR